MKFAHDSTDREHNLHLSATYDAPRRRFALWILVVLATLAAPLWCRSPAATLVGTTQALLGLGIFLHLLKSTPANAIRLPWALSAAIILLGAALMPPLAHQSFNPVTMIAPILLALLLLAVLFNPTSPLSPWWATLVVWHPAFWAPEQPALIGWNLEAILIRIALILAGLVIYAAANAWRPRLLWSVAAASALATLIVLILHQ